MHLACAAFLSCLVLSSAQRWPQNQAGARQQGGSAHGGNFEGRGGAGKGPGPAGFGGYNDCTNDNPMQCMQALSSVIKPPQMQAGARPDFAAMEAAFKEQCPAIQSAIGDQTLTTQCCNLNCKCQELLSGDANTCGGKKQVSAGSGGFGARGGFGKAGSQAGGFGHQGHGPMGPGFAQCQKPDVQACMQGLQGALDFHSMMPQPGQDMKASFSQNCPTIQQAIQSKGLADACCNLDCMCQASQQDNEQVCGGRGQSQSN